MSHRKCHDPYCGICKERDAAVMEAKRIEDRERYLERGEDERPAPRGYQQRDPWQESHGDEWGY